MNTPAWWRHPAVPYVAPFILFGILLSLEPLFFHGVYFIYPLKTILVGALILGVWHRLPSLSVERPIGSVIVGIVGFVLWVGLDPFLVQHTYPLGGFNPYVLDLSLFWIWVLIVFRMVGAVLIVPIMEELFWRGFLMRYLIQEDFEKVPLGTYTHFSFWVTTACFASVHGAQWPLGLIVGLLFGLWFLKTKNLGNVIVAHAVTNLLLAIYVLTTYRWYFW